MVKYVYWVQMEVLSIDNEKQEVLRPSLDAIYQRVWSLNISPKVKHFLWRCLSNALPVAENMVHRHIAKDKRCNRCGEADGSLNHLLFQCHYARLMWAEANVHTPPPGAWADSLFSNIHWVLNLKKAYPMDQVEEDLAPWLLWKNRNKFIFMGKDYEAPATVEKVWDDVKE